MLNRIIAKGNCCANWASEKKERKKEKEKEEEDETSEALRRKRVSSMRQVHSLSRESAHTPNIDEKEREREPRARWVGVAEAVGALSRNRSLQVEQKRGKKGLWKGVLEGPKTAAAEKQKRPCARWRQIRRRKRKEAMLTGWADRQREDTERRKAFKGKLVEERERRQTR